MRAAAMLAVLARPAVPRRTRSLGLPLSALVLLAACGASDGSANDAAKSARCSVTPNPASVGADFVVTVSGYQQGMPLRVQITSPSGTTSVTGVTTDSGELTTVERSTATGTGEVRVFSVLDSERERLDTSCSFEVTAPAPCGDSQCGAAETCSSCPADCGECSGECLPAWGSFVAGNWPSGCWRPYSATSPFNQRIPPDPRLHPNSAAIVANLNSFGFGPGPIQVIDPTIGREYDYAHPTYYSQPTDPLFTLHCTMPWGTCAVEGMQVRIPDAARPAGGGDAHLTVVDQETGWEWDMWYVQSKPAGGGSLEFGWGGRTRIDGDGLGGNAVAGGYGNLAGIIRAQEMEAGVIEHALFMVVGCTAEQPVWPANTAALTCAESGGPTANAIPNGARLQLDMSDAEIAALAAPAWKKAVLAAMAHYGIYVGDTAGGDPMWGVVAESDEMYTSLGYPGRFVEFANANGIPLSTNQYRFELADGVDWSRLRVIDPCVAQGSCQ